MIFQFSLYYLSFLPLWISIIIIDVVSYTRHNDNLWTERLCLMMLPALTLVCLIIVFMWIKEDSVQNKEQYTIESATEKHFMTAEFIMTYVVPMFAFDFTQWDGVALFVVFFLTFWFLVYRHYYLCTNIVLEIADYRIYECGLKVGQQTIQKNVVSRKNLEELIGEEIHTKKFNNNYHFELC